MGNLLSQAKECRAIYQFLLLGGIVGWHNIPISADPGIIIGRKGSVGTVYYSSKPFYCIDTAYYIKPSRNYHLKFLYYLLKNLKLDRLNSDSAVPGLNRDNAYSQTFYLPPLDAQKKIAWILSAFDDKIELNNKINQNLEALAQAILEKNITNINTRKLGDIILFFNGYAFKSSTHANNGKFKIITIKNVLDGEIDSLNASKINEKPSNLKEFCLLSIGDVLMSLTGNVGRVGIVYEQNLLLNQRVAKIVPYDKSHRGLIYFILRLSAIKASLERIAKGTAQPNLSTIDAANIPIPFSKDIPDDTKNILNSLFLKLISNFQESRRLAQLRDTLLPKLMSGEIDVSDVAV